MVLNISFLSLPIFAMLVIVAVVAAFRCPWFCPYIFLTLAFSPKSWPFFSLVLCLRFVFLFSLAFLVRL